MARLEVCVDSLASLDAAIAGGADRIELCSALGTGGVTPSLGLLSRAVARSPVPIIALIRCRAGDFVYSRDEVAAMALDAAHCVRAGAAGVAVGALTPDGEVDVEALRSLARAAREAGAAEVVFHRAFDVSADPMRSLEVLHGERVDRLLTSGQAQSAEEGTAVLRDLRARAQQLAAGGAHRVAILAGAGVAPGNVARLVADAGVDQVHASAGATVQGEARFRPAHRGIGMGGAGEDGFSRRETGSATVRALKEALTGSAGVDSAPPCGRDGGPVVGREHLS